MVNGDLLVRKKWAEWRNFSIEWSNRSYDDFDKWLGYKDKMGPELMDIAKQWKIFYHPKKDNGEEDKENISFTPEFQSYWRPNMKNLFEVNSSIMDNVVRKAEVSPFIEYGFVQIIAYYIGMNKEQFNNLPTKDPTKLNTLFELSQMVFRLLDNEFSGGDWDKITESQEDMLKDRKEFKKRVLKK